MKQQRSYFQLLLVFGAFFLMVLTGYLFVRNILWNRLRESALHELSAVEGRIGEAFAEADALLLSNYYAVADMIKAGASQEDLFIYLSNTSARMTRREEEAGQARALHIYGIYGYIRGEFIDSMGLNPGSDFIPQRRPWYQTAVRNPGKTAYTVPYADALSGDSIISAVRNIENGEGGIDGILALDVNISRLNAYVQNISLSPGGYGILLNQNMQVVAHPRQDLRGRTLEELGEDYIDVSRLLRTGETVSAAQISDSGGTAGKALVFFTPLSNGWYVGLVTPRFSFYRDLYYVVAGLSVLGLVLAFVLALVLLRIDAARLRADEENQAKSSFLARMSHEIRTPMNAIIGMGELALQAEPSPRVAEYITGIKQAGDNLLTLINDILDFSKIEAGSLEINTAPYRLSSLLNDVINVSRVRAGEKALLFTVNVDANIPDQLSGDQTRIRQILLNLISNAAKYTREGYIALAVNALPAAENPDRLILSMEVADSGVGIKAEDLPNLFGNFVRLDMEKNRNIEGTGLGLAITRSLCRAMGGDITVQSEYGAGSVFTARIPQGYIAGSPLAAVENPEHPAVLLYDHLSRRAASISRTLENLGVPCTPAADDADFLAKLKSGGPSGAWPFAFVSSRGEQAPLCAEAAALVENKKLPTKLVLLADQGDRSFAGIPELIIPAWAVPIANFLNGRKDDEKREKAEVRFTAPDARVLIVDDIATNLTVAEGLMIPYRMELTTCISGRESVELVKRREYDLVFMDHMMPDMDGIAATAAIREWEKETKARKPVSIIALTANAITGMKEMFLEKGFNDYLSKPIEIARLNKILEKWIPRDKQVKGSREKVDGSSGSAPIPHSLILSGVDVGKGIAMTGGTVEGYKKVLSMFRKDAEERLTVLQNVPEEKDMPHFVTQVHALKSASGSIGAAELSAEAARLEAAGKTGDMALIGEALPAFAKQLEALAARIKEITTDHTDHTDREEKITNQESVGSVRSTFPLIGGKVVNPLLGELVDALETQKANVINRILKQIPQQSLDLQTREALEQISDLVLMSEYEEAAEKVKELSGQMEDAKGFADTAGS
ncbi:hypothetical protein AGMMS50268_17820 [Spirochaetia bacterium]|nr:hypothetical protein AGMMS50268_17820 [Spirochaetia bacterium]